MLSSAVKRSVSIDSEVAAAAEAIDYPNFKATVAVRQGASRSHVYADVWAVMRTLKAAEERR